MKSSWSLNLIFPPAVKVFFDRGCYSCTFQQRYCCFFCKMLIYTEICSFSVLVYASATSCWFSVHVENFAFIFGWFFMFGLIWYEGFKKWCWVGNDTSFRFNFLASCQKHDFFLFYHPFATQQSLISTRLTRLSAQLSPVSCMLPLAKRFFGKGSMIV